MGKLREDVPVPVFTPDQLIQLMNLDLSVRSGRDADRAMKLTNVVEVFEPAKYAPHWVRSSHGMTSLERCVHHRSPAYAG